MFISNSPRFTITKNKNSTITIVCEFLKKKEIITVEKLDNIRSIIEKFIDENDFGSSKIIIQSNIQNVKGVCSRCKVDVSKFIFIGNNDNKIYF